MSLLTWPLGPSAFSLGNAAEISAFSLSHSTGYFKVEGHFINTLVNGADMSGKRVTEGLNFSRPGDHDVYPS